LAHRISPYRIVKRQRIAARQAMPDQYFANLGITRARLLAFEQQLQGTMVTPGDADYDKDRQLSNPAFQAFPKMICYCVVENDVALCLQIATDYQFWIAIRSGGHSTAGYSVNSGLVIDLSQMNGIVLNDSETTVTVQAGCDFDTFNAALDPTGMHVPTGACGNVCIGGFVQGGGYGYTSRMFGIQCDNVLAMRVMLANGNIVTADVNQNQDLLWAMCGGTGGNFGVLLSVTYALSALPSVWAYAISWPVADAAAVLQMQQALFARSGAPPQLGYMMNIGFDPNGNPAALMQGMYCGDAAGGMAALQPLLNLGNAQLVANNSGAYGAMDQWLDSHPYSMPNNPPGSREDKVSGYLSAPLSVAGWQNVVDQFFNNVPSAAAIMYTEPYGGAIMSPPAGGNAFVHRQVDMNVVFETFWTGDDSAPSEQWLQNLQDQFPFIGDEVYQNYPRSSYTNYRYAYFGDAFRELRMIKMKYDPNGVFTYQQVIQDYPPGAELDPRARAAGPRRFADTPIVYTRPPSRV
jgi:hypothetical protein